MAGFPARQPLGERRCSGFPRSGAAGPGHGAVGAGGLARGGAGAAPRQQLHRPCPSRGGLPEAIDEALRAWREKRVPSGSPLLARLYERYRQDSSADGLDRFHGEQFRPRRRADDWVERGLVVIIGVGPMLGVAGTVTGMIEAFGDLGAKQEEMRVADLGQPISLSLKATLFGICCSAACTTVKVLFPIRRLHQEQEVLVDVAWRRLAALSSVPGPAPPSRNGKPFENRDDEPEGDYAAPNR